MEIVVRCWDKLLNTQPFKARSAWDWGLHVTSSCHCVKIYRVNKKTELTKARIADFAKRGKRLVPIARPTEFLTMTSEDYEKCRETHEPRDVDQ